MGIHLPHHAGTVEDENTDALTGELSLPPSLPGPHHAVCPSPDVARGQVRDHVPPAPPLRHECGDDRTTNETSREYQLEDGRGASEGDVEVTRQASASAKKGSAPNCEGSTGKGRN